MRMQQENIKDEKNNQRFFHLIIVLLLGLGIGTLSTLCFVAQKSSSGEKKTASVNKKNADVEKRSPMSLDRAALKTVILAQKMAEADRETNLQNSEESQESKHENEEMENEINLLRKALPGNIFVPGKRTEEELQQQVDSLGEQQYLREVVKKNAATQDDLNRYYELKSKPLNDELALLDFCEKNAMESEQQGVLPLVICTEVVAHGSDRRQAGESALAKLQQDFNNGFKEQNVEVNQGRASEIQLSKEENTR